MIFWKCPEAAKKQASPCWVVPFPHPAPFFPMHIHFQQLCDPQPPSSRAAKGLASSPYLDAVFPWKLGLDYSWISPRKTSLREDWCKTPCVSYVLPMYIPVALRQNSRLETLPSSRFQRLEICQSNLDQKFLFFSNKTRIGLVQSWVNSKLVQHLSKSSESESQSVSKKSTVVPDGVFISRSEQCSKFPPRVPKWMIPQTPWFRSGIARLQV